MKIKERILNSFVDVGIKVLGKDRMAYILGINLKPKRTFSNDGYSEHTWCVASCHPLNSITWHWAVYWTKPAKMRDTFKMFRIHKQELMIRK